MTNPKRLWNGTNAPSVRRMERRDGLNSTRPFQWRLQREKAMDLSTVVCPTPLQQAAVFPLGATASSQFTGKCSTNKFAAGDQKHVSRWSRKNSPMYDPSAAKIIDLRRRSRPHALLCVSVLHQDIPPNQVTYSEMITIRKIAGISHITHSITCEQHVQQASQRLFNGDASSL